MKILAAREPIVVVPVVVKPVEVHAPATVALVEASDTKVAAWIALLLRNMSSITPPVEYSPG